MASQSIGDLVVRLIGDGSSFQKMITTAVTKTKQLGKTLTSTLSLPLLGIGTLSVRSFSQFDQAMTQSTSIMSATAEQIERMRQTALTLSSSVSKAPKDLAEAYFFLASAGLDAEQSIAALPATTAFATAGAFDMARATDLLTDAQSALGLTVSNAAQNLENMNRVSDVFVRANTLANASVEQFSIAITSQAGSALKTFNKQIEEGVAVLAAMADQGIKAELAGNNLSRIIRLLSKASQDNQDAFKELGFSVFDSTGSMRNMADIVGNLEDVLEGLTDQQKAATLTALGFEARVQGAILPLVGMSEKIRQYEHQLRSATGFTESVANKQMQSFSNQIAITRNQLTRIAIEIGNTLAPWLLKLNEYIKQGLQVWSNLSDNLKRTIVVTGLVVAAIGPLLLVASALIPVIGTVGTLLAGLLTPLGAIVGALGAVVVSVIHFGVGWKNAFNIVSNFFRNTFAFFVNFRENISILISWFKESWYTLFLDLIRFGVHWVSSMTQNAIIAVETLFRIWTTFQGFMFGLFKKIFTVDFVNMVLKGIQIAAEKFYEFALDVGEIISKGLAGNTSAIQQIATKFSNQFISDFENGAEKGLFNSINNILKEQAKKLKNPFAFDPITRGPELNLTFPPEQLQALEEQSAQVLNPMQQKAEEIKKTLHQALNPDNVAVFEGSAALIRLQSNQRNLIGSENKVEKNLEDVRDELREIRNIFDAAASVGSLTQGF